MTCEDLAGQILQYLPGADLSAVNKAYSFAEEAHSGQKRASGDGYFTHCEAVAGILTGLHLDPPTIAAALLHDVLEDTGATAAVLSREFGPEITSMVEGLTAISSLHFHDRETAQAENWRKMLLAVAKDIRIIIIKLADRLHNMRTVGFLPEDRRAKLASESLTLFAPFAHRLGITRIKNELEELSFAELYPEEYSRIKISVNDRQEDALHAVESWRGTLSLILAGSGILYRLNARTKTPYGIFCKMRRFGRAFEDIQDIIGLRIITDTEDHCYSLLGIITAACAPLPDSMTDYIRFPKGNMYQSIHITVGDPRLGLAEIQIRTEEMHRHAEYGVAAHWRYKESADGPAGKALSSASRVDEYMDWLKHILEWQEDLTDAREFLSGLTTACAFDEIYVFTPKKDVIRLPEGATPLDLAYAVHSDIGDHCCGAKVGGKMVPLTHTLRSGEACEIVTDSNVVPGLHWLEIAVTPHARSRIRRYLRDKKA